LSERKRVILIGLDGFELSIADRLMDEGKLPVLKRLREIGAHMVLDHGPAKRTGLAWEHVATGLSPDAAKRWSAVDFDPATYAVWQRPTALLPFAADLPGRTVVFDPPYFDLKRTPGVRGMVNWGAHDPGVDTFARPEGLLAEIEERFGTYPASESIYGFCWPSAERTEALGRALVRAVERRSEMTLWLFGERLPDWDFGFTVVSEYHSAIEALWHGVDPAHPLHDLPSSAPARRGLEDVYEAGDRMLGRLVDRFPDARFVVFNLHGMGGNNADVADMALLPELLYRHSFGRPCMRAPVWPLTRAGVPVITGNGAWEGEMDRVLPHAMRRPGRIARGLAALGRRLTGAAEDGRIPLDWMPGARYRRFWPRMRAFAYPSFYDGQVRLNLKGREAQGLVDPDDYELVCDELETLLAECRDPITGAPVLASVERMPNPLERGPSEADMIILWKGAPLGFSHPRLGTIGPLPYRRPGGHTGNRGFACIAGPGVSSGDLGTRSAFDIVPTVIDLLGAAPLATSGASFADALRPEPVPALA
jgi:predicted AlkP superfamily phosphohydrolase/phosphomutase